MNLLLLCVFCVSLVCYIEASPLSRGYKLVENYSAKPNKITKYRGATSYSKYLRMKKLSQDEESSNDDDHIVYQYKYGVNDQYTGDIKSHQEERSNGVVRGQYSFLQPDGKTRVVTYAADKYGGFHAHVTYI